MTSNTGGPTGGSARKKRHHYRPVLHLRKFVDASGRLWVYGRDIAEPFRQIPERVGYVKYLYSPEDGPDPLDDAVENWFADVIDGPAAPVLDRLIENAYATSQYGLVLPPADRSAFSRFIAAQDMRTPRARDFLVGGFQRHADRVYQNWTQDLRSLQQSIDRDSGYLYTLEELEEHVATTEIVANKGQWLDYISSTIDPAARHIFAMRWHVVTAPRGTPFVTTDMAIAKFFTDFGKPCTWRMGFALGATHWVMPLSPAHAILLVPMEDSREVPRASPAWVRKVNRRLVLDAWQYTFTRDSSPFVAVIWGGQRVPQPDVWPEWMLPDPGNLGE